MRRRIILGLALVAATVVYLRSARSEAVEQIAPVGVAAPLYAYGPDAVDPPKIRPRYNGQTYQPRRPYAGSGNSQYWNWRRGDRYNAGRDRDYGARVQGGGRDYRRYERFSDRRDSFRGYARRDDGRRYNRTTPSYGYRASRPSPRNYQNEYAARIITPQLRGQWRDLGPVYQSRPY
jgi:hypothetical protein